MSWEEGERNRGWTRREWVKLGMTVGAIGTLGSLGAVSGRQLVPPPIEFSGEIRETIYYTKFPTPQWWNSKVGTPVKVGDFKEWDGATGVWRGLFQDDAHVPGTGFPVLVIRVKRDDTVFAAPDDISLPEGFSLFYDDPTADVDPDTGQPRGVRIIVAFDRCVHLCCYPGWHVVDNPPPDRRYIAPTPTYEKYGEDPIYCVCHGSQYEPMTLVQHVNPRDNATYVGALHTHGPADRALPIIAVKVEGGNLVGGMADPAWYVYCG